MTDLEKWKEFLDSFDIEYRIESNNDAIGVVMEAKSRNVAGYSGFCAEITFNKEQEFKEVAVYE